MSAFAPSADWARFDLTPPDVSARLAAAVDRLLADCGPSGAATVGEESDSLVAPQIASGLIETVPYVRGGLALTRDAADALLELQWRDARAARRVFDRMQLLASTPAAYDHDTVILVDGVLVTVRASLADPTLVVTVIS